jgi:hypothetical protein
MTTPPSQVSGTWTQGGTTFTNFSPNTPSSTGEFAGNISRDVSGSGLRVTYPTTLSAANSPVRYGTSLIHTGTGLFYSYRTVQFSSNWRMAAAGGTKLYEPRVFAQGNGAGATENHVGGAGYQVTNNASILQAQIFLQGPNSQSLVINPSTSTIGIVTGGAPHTVEEIWQQDSPAGAGNATYQCWVDGALTINRTGLTMIAAGNTPGWNFYMVDPTYGGVGSSPPVQMYHIVDKLYVATK